MTDLQCDISSNMGPIDKRVLAELNKRFPLDQDYLNVLQKCHGGKPKLKKIKAGKHKFEIAFFLPLIDEDSKLPGEFQPHFDDNEIDERAMVGVTALLDYESQTSRCLFGNLVPFASTQDDMCLDRAYVDLFCFDYRGKPSTPPVVLWKAHNALDALFEWDTLPLEEQFDDDDNYLSVSWDKFLIPIADSFSEFTSMLKA